MSHLTKKERRSYTKVFKEVDLDGNGHIDRNELSLLCEKLGFSFNQEQTEELFSQLDNDGSGTVTLEEFLAAMQPVKKRDKRRATIKRLFKEADDNKDGLLTADEIYKILISAAEEHECPVELPQVEAFISQADLDGDGKLNYEEFVKVFETVVD